MNDRLDKSTPTQPSGPAGRSPARELPLAVRNRASSPPSLREKEGARPCNIAAALPRMAAERGEQVALRCPGSRGSDGLARYDLVLTCAQLDARSDAIAAGLATIGIVRGVRAVLMVRPSPEFFLLMFALFKLGAVPVLVDPGIDRRALKQCLDEAQPQAFIGIPLAHAARIALGWANSARIRVTVGRRWCWGGKTLKRIEAMGAGAGPQLADTQPDDIAAILFTSGSTGVPKGVVYRHRHFVAQIELLRTAFGIRAGGVDLPTFPPFALFDPALGLTSIIPDMDPTRPASADPRKLHDAIARFGVTQLFGSPALVDVLARHGAKLPTIRKVLSAGAPVPPDVVAKMRALLPDDAQLWTPYGATECLPVAVIEGRELQSTREATENGAGTCVGRPVAPNVVRIIRITDEAIADWSDDLLVGDGEVGEIAVAGPTATDAYFERPEATRLAKIREAFAPTQPSPACGGRLDAAATSVMANEAQSTPSPGTRIVHRMGDVGYFDAQGRLWFCGRKSQRVETADGPLYTEQVEPVFNAHPDVRRTALVGVGERARQTPMLCVELQPGIHASQQARILAELRAIGQRHPHTARITRFLIHPKFPVDIRHNAKIGREKLAAWAATTPSLSPKAK
ncbi:MAG: AMP-binding protein [Proteobacteria bacterium]|nr:AMP-binding protein [Pseudomonadota bacterium]